MSNLKITKHIVTSIPFATIPVGHYFQTMDFNYWQKIRTKRARNLDTGKVIELLSSIPFVQDCDLGGPIRGTWSSKRATKAAMRIDLKEWGLTRKEIVKAEVARKREPKEFRMTSMLRQVQLKRRALAQIGMIDSVLYSLRCGKKKEALATLSKMKDNLAVANRGEWTSKNIPTISDYKPAPIPPEQLVAGNLLDSRFNKRTKGPKLQIEL